MSYLQYESIESRTVKINWNIFSQSTDHQFENNTASRTSRAKNIDCKIMLKSVKG